MSYGKFKLVHREKQIAPDRKEISEEVEVLAFVSHLFTVNTTEGVDKIKTQLQAVCLCEDYTVRGFPITMLHKQKSSDGGYLGENPIVET